MVNTRMRGNQMMACGASAPRANAAFSCPQTTSMQSAGSTIALILDAILMASIIICGLVIRLSVLAFSLVLLVLIRLVSLLPCEKVNVPERRVFV